MITIPSISTGIFKGEYYLVESLSYERLGKYIFARVQDKESIDLALASLDILFNDTKGSRILIEKITDCNYTVMPKDFYTARVYIYDITIFDEKYKLLLLDGLHNYTGHSIFKTLMVE